MDYTDADYEDWQTLVDEKRDALIAGDKLTEQLATVTAERDKWKRRAVEMETEIEAICVAQCVLCGKHDLIRIANRIDGCDWYHAVEPEPIWCEAGAIRERQYQRQNREKQ